MDYSFYYDTIDFYLEKLHVGVKGISQDYSNITCICIKFREITVSRSKKYKIILKPKVHATAVSGKNQGLVQKK